MPETVNSINMKRIVVLLTALMLQHVVLQAQTSAEEAVKAVVNQLFAGMKQSDSVMIATAFSDSALMQTIVTNKDGQTVVKNMSPQSFASLVTKRPKGSLDEQIVFETVRVSGPLAIVWTPYKFYFSGKFSHCGVNSFQLVKFGEHWKIQYIIDTREKEGCE